MYNFSFLTSPLETIVFLAVLALTSLIFIKDEMPRQLAT